MTKKEARLTIIGRQRDESGQETVTETTVTAEYYQRDGSHYILYEERLEGMDTPVKNTLKLKHSVLELTRKGPVNSRMVFEAGAEHMTDYSTPYGTLRLGVRTHSLEADSQAELLEIRAEYTLTSAGISVSDCDIRIVLRQ